jgi:polyisoprenoid-binding protein YceI
MQTLLRSIAFAGFTIVSAAAAPVTFDFKDPKGVNAIQFTLDSVLEPIAGTAGAVAGTVTFDDAAVASTAGKITVEAKSLKVPNSVMTEHILAADWVDAETHGEIAFAFGKLEDVKETGAGKWSAVAKGEFTLKGVTRAVEVPVTLSYLPGQMGKRINKPELGGDLLVVRGAFEINRADYGIQPGKHEEKVAPAIQLTFALVGSAPKA